MGVTLVALGLFLWFALAFNAGVGEPFVNYLFFASALFMVIAGCLQIFSSYWRAARFFCVAALASYLPMIWQRFNSMFGPDWFGLLIDIVIVVYLLKSITRIPDK